MIRIAVLGVLLVGVASTKPADVVVVRRGPPLICFPIEIGSAVSLPPSQPESDPPAAKPAIVAETVRILAASDEALVHMETLRRAYMRLWPERLQATESRNVDRGVHELLAILKDAALVASAPSRRDPVPQPHREALAWLDVGYLLAIDTNGNWAFDGAGSLPRQRILERAAACAPRDAALQFAVAFGQANCIFDSNTEEGYEGGYWRRHSTVHLLAAMDLTTDPASLLAKNICSLFSPAGYYGVPTTFEALRKELNAPTTSRAAAATRAAPALVYRDVDDMDDDTHPVDRDVAVVVRYSSPNEQFHFEIHRDGTTFIPGAYGMGPPLVQRLDAATLERVVDAFVSRGVPGLKHWCRAGDDMPCGAYIRLILNARGIERRVYAYCFNAEAFAVVQLIADLKRLLPIHDWVLEQDSTAMELDRQTRAHEKAAASRPESRAEGGRP